MSGEKQGRRDQVQDTARRWTKNGMDPKAAQEKARECARTLDRREARKK